MARVKGKQPKQFYTKQEAMDILGVSQVTIYRWIKAGKLTAVKVGTSKFTRPRITRKSIEALLGEPIAEPAPIDAAPSDASPSPGEGATGADVDAASAAKPGSLADVFTTLDGLREAIERAKANPHYCHVKGKLNGVMDVLQNVSQELAKAEGLADDLSFAFSGRPYIDKKAIQKAADSLRAAGADAAPSDASPSPGEGADDDPGAVHAQD